jgi:hypothetical protein
MIRAAATDGASVVPQAGDAGMFHSVCTPCGRRASRGHPLL